MSFWKIFAKSYTHMLQSLTDMKQRIERIERMEKLKNKARAISNQYKDGRIYFDLEG